MEITPLIYFIIPQFGAKGLLSTGILLKVWTTQAVLKQVLSTQYNNVQQ